MRRISRPDDDDAPVLEIELVGDDPAEVVGAGVEREPLRRRIRGRVEQVRRSARQIIIWRRSTQALPMVPLLFRRR